MNIYRENIAISKAKIQFSDRFVIKTGSGRLVNQAKQQSSFSRNYKIDNFYAPHIYEVGENYFKMDKINGQSWYDFFIYSSVKEINKFFNSIINYLLVLKASKTRDFYLNGVVKWKLDSLYGDSRHKKFVKFLEKLLPIKISPSFCHGDFTLSNMIFKDGICLIDFLDSFVESYIIDLIKIRQDCFYKWCLIYNDIQSVKCEIILNKLDSLLSETFSQEINSQVFEVLEAINILRIEPYIPKEKSHIIDRMLAKNPLYVNFNSTSLR